MIGYKEFEVIKTMLLKKLSDAESICDNVYHNVFENAEEVRTLMLGLEEKGYLADGKVTQKAMVELEPCRVKNAVILAAGGSDISAKSVYSMPKGLFMKGGESLVERQIRQLREAGIHNITVVIGYKQELYFFLQDKWGVNLEINPDLKKNNIYSLYIARNHLESTYICNCDNYFAENPFSAYEYSSFHATVYKDDAQNELLVRKNRGGRILDIYSGAKSGECIYGHAYVDPAFSALFRGYLEAEIADFRVSALFWEEFVKKHVDDLDMYVHEYSPDFLFEFDEIQQIQNIEGLFLDSVSEQINEKICSVLKCRAEEISDIVILQKGLTNVLFTFVVRGERYIFRYPGDSSAFFIYRKNECIAQKLAAQAHADDTYIYIDEAGVKISKFRENCIDLHGIYYHDVEVMKQVAKKIRAFHEKGYDLPDWELYDYDPIYQC